jgi:hypothetical protein
MSLKLTVSCIQTSRWAAKSRRADGLNNRFRNNFQQRNGDHKPTPIYTQLVKRYSVLILQKGSLLWPEKSDTEVHQSVQTQPFLHTIYLYGHFYIIS